MNTTVVLKEGTDYSIWNNAGYYCITFTDTNPYYEGTLSTEVAVPQEKTSASTESGGSSDQGDMPDAMVVTPSAATNHDAVSADDHGEGTQAKAVKPARVSKPSVKIKKKNKVKVSWKKADGAAQYQVMIAENKGFTKGARYYFTKARSKTIKVKAEKTYYVRVKAYGNVLSGKWSKVKKIKVKKAKVK